MSGDVIRITGDATVFEAVKTMVHANVGAILVTGDDPNVIEGIFTERDYLRRIAVEGRTSRDTLVNEVMTSPVMVGDRLLGMVSIGDLVRQQSLEHSFQVRYLTEYISAR